MYKIITLLVTSTVLTACLGFGDKSTPDEMAVLDTAPLTLPPNFELRPPRQGLAPAVEEGNKKAKELILGADDKEQPQTKNDSWLVEKAGGEERNSSIREIMAEESRSPIKKVKKKGWFESLFSDDENADPTLEELADMAKKDKKQ